ncbi:MAG: hypothetical protein U0R17_04200 [Acidimicrobiia bacterium]
MGLFDGRPPYPGARPKPRWGHYGGFSTTRPLPLTQADWDRHNQQLAAWQNWRSPEQVAQAEKSRMLEETQKRDKADRAREFREGVADGKHEAEKEIQEYRYFGKKPTECSHLSLKSDGTFVAANNNFYYLTHREEGFRKAYGNVWIEFYKDRIRKIIDRIDVGIYIDNTLREQLDTLLRDHLLRLKLISPYEAEAVEKKYLTPRNIHLGTLCFMKNMDGKILYDYLCQNVLIDFYRYGKDLALYEQNTFNFKHNSSSILNEEFANGYFEEWAKFYSKNSELIVNGLTKLELDDEVFEELKRILHVLNKNWEKIEPDKARKFREQNTAYFDCKDEIEITNGKAAHEFIEMHIRNPLAQYGKNKTSIRSPSIEGTWAGWNNIDVPGRYFERGFR